MSTYYGILVMPEMLKFKNSPPKRNLQSGDGIYF